MNPAEYHALARIDRTHWFYVGKRAIVRWWLERFLHLTPDSLLIDAGMGTGTWLEEMGTVCRILGLDSSPESLAIARPRIQALGGDVLQTTLDRIDLPDGTATVVTMLDVLEHLDDDLTALREAIRLTRPGGLVVVTVPALRWLWSDWDVVLHHRRRYHLQEFRLLISQPEVEVLHCAYFNSLLLPLVFLVRMWRKVFPPKAGAPRAEDRIPAAPVNFLLEQLLVRPACWPWFHPPAGVSLLAVLRRKGTVAAAAEPCGT
ncbi:MAG: class I SAM-dependent methyltransferase [Blastocatellia bacterium]|nr:class I SAM-dependent methyltransferase [Blastocatellia bacterium]